MLSCWNKAQQLLTCNGQKKSNRTSDVHRKPFDLPKEVCDFMTCNESFSRSDDEYRGEGGDYVTKNENKHTKGHSGPGVPALQH